MPPLTTAEERPRRRRREQPLLAVHTGRGKGTSTAAFALMLRGWDIGVDQFVRSGTARGQRGIEW